MISVPRPFITSALATLCCCAIFAADISAKTPDMSGRWALLRVTQVRDEVPVVGMVKTQLKVLLLMDAVQKGRTVTTREKVCRMQMKNDSKLINARFHKGLVKGLSGSKRTFRLEGSKSSQTIKQAEQVFLWGAQLKQPTKDALPTKPDDPRVVDQDDDGKPGMTIRVSGLVKGEMFVVQRDWSEWTGRWVSPDRIEGSIRWRFERVVLDRTSPVLPLKQTAYADKDPKNNRFKMVRVPKGTNCKKLATLKKQLFGKPASSSN